MLLGPTGLVSPYHIALIIQNLILAESAKRYIVRCTLENQVTLHWPFQRFEASKEDSKR
ncbi:hypothetical protein TWF569_008538 [Orbilia oligospora]|nr:hypothetical protein TWF103_001809 [Orbilia oligospora]KAF3139281.1 hypothetical protein TWF569_008538 [Orbilia oligospora]